MRMRFAFVLLLGMLVFGLSGVNDARAAPSFQAAGTAVSGTGSVFAPWPAHAVGDIALLFVESAGGQAVTLTTPAGFAAVTGSPQATGTTTNGTRITVFWARATSTSMSTPQVADPGNHVYARILTYRGVIDSGDPWDVTGGGVKAVASTSVTVTGVTTTVPDTLIVQAVARDNDSAAAAFSAQANGNLTGIAEQSDDGTNSGNGGGIGIWDGVKATAGATGDTTATVTSSINAFLTIALRPGSITLADGTDPANAAIAPGGAATMADAFTFTTAAGSNAVSQVVVGLAAGTSGGLSLVEITNDAGTTVYGSVVDPGSDTPSITLSTNTLTATTTTTQFKIRVTPKSHVNMPVPPGSAYSVTAKIDSWTSNYTPSGSDTAGTTVTIDNLSPANATASSCTAGTEEVTLGWTNPADSDFDSVVALRDTAAVSDTPVEGTTYTVGNTIGSSTVACATGASPCTDTGLTGGTAYHYRLFARDSNGNYSATGVVPSGSPCTPAAPAVPRFNACDVGTTCTNTTPSTQLYTKRAGVAFNLDLVALNTNGSRNTSYNNTVSVELLDSSDNSALPDSDGCRSTWSNIVTLSPDPSFVPASNGLITVGPFTLANAYREVRVRVTNVGGPARRGCSTDNFSVRPTAFTVTSTDATNTDTSGTPAIKAGASFNLTAASVAGYDGTPSVDNTAGMVVGTPTAGTIGGSFSAAPIGTGTATGSTFTYSEVGSFGLNANAIFDSSFTSVDSPGVDCIVGFSNTLTGGQYGCSIGSTAVAQTTGSSGFGRFIPDNFNVTYNVPVLAAACGTFSYVGQGFTYTTAPVMTVTARNGAGLGNATTTNYAGSYMKLTNSSVTPGTHGARYSRFDALGAGATPALDTGGLPAETGDPAIGTFTNGVGTLTFSSGSGLGFARSTTTPNAPFDADIALALNVIDTDGVAFGGNPAAFGSATSGGGVSFSGGKNQRFGRLRVLGAVGLATLPLDVPLRAEYWTGTGFALNALDSCTSLERANVTQDVYQKSLNACETIISTTPVTLAAGVGNLRLSAPGSGNEGSLNLTPQLGASAAGNFCNSVGGAEAATSAAARSYLQGAWTGATYDQNPSARAAFGTYGAQPRNFIFFRENY